MRYYTYILHNHDFDEKKFIPDWQFHKGSGPPPWILDTEKVGQGLWIALRGWLGCKYLSQWSVMLLQIYFKRNLLASS